MTPGLLLTLAILAVVVASTAATAVQVLHEFWRHELEEYCRRRGKLDWYKRIIELREELALGATTLQMISIATAIVCGILHFYSQRTFEIPSAFGLIGLIGIWSLILLAANCWIPWGVRMISAASFLYRTWRLWWAVSLMLGPLAAGVEVATTLFQRMTGKQKRVESEEATFEGEIMSMVSEGEHEGLLEQDAREMIEGVFDLDDNVVAKVMTPRSRVDFISVDSTWEEFTQVVANTGRTRIPVVRGNLNRIEDVLGVLYVKDLLAEYIKDAGDRKNILEMVRVVMFVHSTRRLDEMLQQFLDQHSHMAVVVDEYGSVAGVITIEDILEEIVGEIIDEHDKEEPGEITRVDKKSFDIDGTVRIDRLNDELGLGMPENQDFDTLSGFIMSRLKSIPKRGHIMQISGATLEIRQASRRAIEHVRLSILAPGSSNPESATENTGEN